MIGSWTPNTKAIALVTATLAKDCSTSFPGLPVFVNRYEHSKYDPRPSELLRQTADPMNESDGLPQNQLKAACNVDRSQAGPSFEPSHARAERIPRRCMWVRRSFPQPLTQKEKQPPQKLPVSCKQAPGASPVLTVEHR